MNTFWQVVLVLLAIGVVIGIVLIVRRRRYIGSFKALGWQFDNSPTLAATYGLNCPPFGLGYSRKIDDRISGATASGIPFAVFEYGSLGYLATLALPRPLPELYLATSARRGAHGRHKTFGQWTVVAADPDWAEAALGRVGQAIDAMAAAGFVVDLSVDGDRLVAVGAPRKADEMQTFLEALAPVAQGLATPALESFRAPQPPSELSVYRRPDWVYRPRDDRFLDEVTRTTYGSSHEARDVVLADVHGMRMIGLTHHWTTTRTETSTDSEGRTSTRTVTEHHDEAILEFAVPWNFGDLSVNQRGHGAKVRFESSDFDRAFTVRCDYPKFASDVFHPRQMEFMLGARPYPFHIQGGRVRFALERNSLEGIDHCARFLVAFFAGVPAFVWEDLGHAEPPISRDLDGF